jgi:acyl-CoA reductase-like NAD-dependent aldehyde dehydrogenase
MDTAVVTSPDQSEALGEVALTPSSGVASVVAGAAAAQSRWSRLPLAERVDVLDAAARSLAEEASELAQLLAAESGKPLAQARFEVDGAIGLLHGNAEEGRRIAGRVLPTEANHGTEWDLAYTRREPLGVVAAILPFNFPVELFVEKCAAALVVGNAVVVKPPLEDPLTVERFRGALIAAGVPEEAMAAAHGDAEVGAALATAPGIAAVSLTGSTAAGIAVAEATAPMLRRLHLELGGNNAALVCEDADLDLVVDEVIRGRLLMNGQACSATKRVLVHRSLHADLAGRLKSEIARQRVGPPTDPETTVGPLIHPRAAERVQSQVDRAREQGGELLAGEGRADGAYFPPCLLGAVPPGSDVAGDDEIFGPVLTLIPVDDHDEAVELANASSFGLMASVFTADLQLAVSLAERLDAGGVVVNGSDNYRPPVIPFGGVKLSGTGREGLGYTIEELSREKTIVLRRFRDASGGEHE